jgi:hypothetical protein
MKDQYTCDVNDYEKYAILRELTAVTGFPLIVVWMLTQADQTGQGNDLTYLDDPDRFRHLDPELFDALKRITASGSRSTSALEESGVLCTARFVRTPLHTSVASRTAMMYAWQTAAAEAGSPLAFFDPDRGLVRKRLEKGSKESDLYLYDDELADAFAASEVLVTFQYRPRMTRQHEFLAALFDRARTACDPALLMALHNGRVAHLIMAHGEHASVVQQAVDRLSKRWRGQLKLATAASLEAACV